MAEEEILVNGIKVPRKDIIITDETDLTIRVVEYELECPYRDGGKVVPYQAADFQVKKDILKKASPVFAAMLGSHWREGKQKVVELHEDTLITTTAIHVWLRIFHGDANSGEILDKVGHTQLFHILKAAEKYALNVDDAKTWFSAWWTVNSRVSLQTARELLFPCWAFGHIRAFAFVTKIVVYSAPNYITPYNPSLHKDCLLPGEILKQLNKAKAGLKDTVQKKLREHMEEFLNRDMCALKEKKYYNHQKRLMTKKIWPFEDTRRDNGIEDLLQRIESLHRAISRVNDSKEAGQGTTANGGAKGGKSSPDCIPCRKLDDSLQEAVLAARKSFDGLCLKCMEASDPETSDSAYFSKERDKIWDRTCKQEGLVHGEKTWFHSYMGEQSFKKRRDHWQDMWDDDYGDSYF